MEEYLARRSSPSRSAATTACPSSPGPTRSSSRAGRRRPASASGPAIRASTTRTSRRATGSAPGSPRSPRPVGARPAPAPRTSTLACLYDDYPVMVLVQLADLGFVPDGDAERCSARARATAGRSTPPAASSRRGRRAPRRDARPRRGGDAAARRGRPAPGPDARLAVVTGYGMVLYRYGACAQRRRSSRRAGERVLQLQVCENWAGRSFRRVLSARPAAAGPFARRLPVPAGSRRPRPGSWATGRPFTSPRSTSSRGLWSSPGLRGRPTRGPRSPSPTTAARRSRCLFSKRHSRRLGRAERLEDP